MRSKVRKEVCILDNSNPSFLDLLMEAHIGLERQGPGSPEVIRQALSFLEAPERLKRIADLGCGSGGQTLLLAEHLPGEITGLDMFPAFIEVLEQNAKAKGLDQRVHGLVGDMAALPFEKASLDLIWSEGAIDNIGFENGLRHWRGFLKTGGYLAVTCPTWLTAERPAEVERFWDEAGSHLDSPEHNISTLQNCGYAFIAAFALPEYCWTENYFAPRAQAIQELAEKYPDSDTMRSYAEMNRLEVELYLRYKQHYGYVFYIGKAI